MDSLAEYIFVDKAREDEFCKIKKLVSAKGLIFLNEK